MLLQFSVENFRSIAQEQTLSLISDCAGKHPENRFSVTDNTKVKLLKSCVIYGANASGKSNLLKALHVMQQIVTSNSNIEDSLPVIPFLLNKEK